MYKLFPCIPIFRGGGFVKKAKRVCICDYVKNCIVTCKRCAFRFEKGYKRVIALGSCKTYCYCLAQQLQFPSISPMMSPPTPPTLVHQPTILTTLVHHKGPLSNNYEF